jgi:hypothetical protein
MYSEDGGVIPAGIEVEEYSGNEHNQMFGVYKGVVRGVIYPDNPESESKDRLEYVVRINGQDYPNSIDMRDGGGQFNYSERVLHPITANVEDGDVSDKAYEEKMNGETVWVMFINGRSDFPLIVGSAQHPLNRKYRKAVGKDGIYKVEEFNGMEFKVDDEGNYCITQVGKKEPDGKVTNEAGVGSTIKFKPNGDYEIIVSETVSLLFDKESQKITMKANENSCTMDENGINMASMKDLLLNIAENIVATAKDINITGDNITITGETKVDGNLTTTGDSQTDGNGNVDGDFSSTGTTNLGGGGPGVARLGDTATGVGAHGVKVSSVIVKGSSKVFAG